MATRAALERALQLLIVAADPPLDLAAKWKHGWIPLNAEAEAILAAKSEHAHVQTQSHEQMAQMALSDLKKHYSQTIKAHGFQHAYTKKVGKAVGSHPEALAATKAKAEAKKAEQAATVATALGHAAPAQTAAAGASKWSQAVVDMKAAGATPNDLVDVQSVKGEKIGLMIKHAGKDAGKQHAVYNAEGQYVGSVNSFTGAQHVLGEKELGKPAGMESPASLGPIEEPEVTLEPPPIKAAKKIAPPKAKKEKPPKFEDPPPPEPPSPHAPGWAVAVGGSGALDSAPVGTIISRANSYLGFKKQADGLWIPMRNYPSGGGWEPSSYDKTPLNSSSVIYQDSAYPLYWGGNGPSSEKPAGYDGPRYAVVETHGGWWIKDLYNGGLHSSGSFKGKSNASKKANYLNLQVHTPTAAQRKAHWKSMQATAEHGQGGASPAAHIVPLGADPAKQLEYTFDPSEAGELNAVGSPGKPESNSLLFGEYVAAADAKRHTANRIQDRMRLHYGYQDQADIDAGWSALAEVGAVPSQIKPEDIAGFDNKDAYYAEPTAGPGVAERGTEEYQRVMREKMVAQMIQLWAQSSNDNHAVTLALQEMAAELFGIQDVAGWSSATSSTKSQIAALRANPAFKQLGESFLRAQYDDTQAVLQSKGIKTLKVRRGVKGGIPAGMAVGSQGVLKMRPMSSWSTNTGTAEGFSSGKWVLHTEVPIGKVIGFASNGFGCLNEYEVVLIGGRTQARLVKSGSSKVSDYSNPHHPARLSA
jgi:hypothetical protein